MASQSRLAFTGAPSTSSPSPPTAEQLQTAFDNAIWYLLSLWHPLHVAVSSLWGGPASADKRDWFAGAVSDLLTTRPDTEADELEAFLLEIMQDEFECNVEDESEVPVARDILRVKATLMEEGSVRAAVEVEERWNRRATMKGDVEVQVVEHDANDEDEDITDVEDETLPQDVQLAHAVTEKHIPEIDEEGFTKVVGKKKRKS